MDHALLGSCRKNIEVALAADCIVNSANHACCTIYGVSVRIWTRVINDTALTVAMELQFEHFGQLSCKLKGNPVRLLLMGSYRHTNLQGFIFDKLVRVGHGHNL